MFDKNSEAGFVLNSVFEFIKAWDSGVNSKLHLKSRNGQAWLNFSCNLGGPQDQHQRKLPKKTKSKSKKKKERDNLRAKLHQQRLQELNSSSNHDLNDSLLVSAYHHSDLKVDSEVVEDEAAAALVPLTEEVMKCNLSLYFHYDASLYGPYSHQETILGYCDREQDNKGFRAYLKKMLTDTIDKYALRSVEIGQIEWGEINYKGSLEHCKNWEFNHLVECEIAVSYKQDQLRRYEYDRRAVPLAIAFRYDYDSDNVTRFVGLKSKENDRIPYNVYKICDPIVCGDPSSMSLQQFNTIIQLKETRRRAT